jgi:hypothetical protein
MDKMLERMEGAARQVVPWFYVLGLITGTGYYFTDGGGNLAKYALSIGFFLAIATELHSFLCQRRIMVAWAALKKATDAASEEEAKHDLWMAAGWLVALLSFQIFTGIMYRATVWHPNTSLLPAGPQIIIAGAVIPIFFFGVSFLTKAVIDPADVQAETQRTTAMKSARAGQKVAMRALDAATRSFDYRLRQAEKAHADLTGLAVSMQRRFHDDDGAQTLMVIDAELRQVEGQKPRPYAGVWRNPDALVKAAPAAGPAATVPPVTPAPAATVPPVTPAVPEPGRVGRPSDEQLEELVSQYSGVS